MNNSVLFIDKLLLTNKGLVIDCSFFNSPNKLNEFIVSLVHLFSLNNNGFNFSIKNLSTFCNSNSFFSFGFIDSINKLQVISTSFFSLGFAIIINLSLFSIIFSIFFSSFSFSLFILSINKLSINCFCKISFSFALINKLISLSGIISIFFSIFSIVKCIAC